MNALSKMRRSQIRQVGTIKESRLLRRRRLSLVVVEVLMIE
jgi:hypothetical protein